jgi:hypothetical protein
MTFRAHNHIYAGRRHLTISVPVSVRRAFEELGVQEGDYLSFEIVEEFKRYRVTLLRPEREPVDERPENRYAFVSVRPEWSDHSALLGCYDDDRERYVRTPVVELLLRAGREEHDAQAQGRKPAPYFIVLDEMNIAKIEHYFSDFLSALESRRYDADGTIRQEKLNLHDAGVPLTWMDEDGVEYPIPPRLAIPTNVLITGTVNDDESTYVLSPKVMDRANTMEFSSVDFDAFLGLAEDDLAQSPFEIPAQTTTDLGLGALELSSQRESQLLRAELAPMLDVNAVLQPVQMHFGYRVLNDVARFLMRTRELIGDRPDVMDAAIDIQLLQKVLPKLFRVSDDRNGVVATLAWMCCTGKVPQAVPERDRLLAGMVVEASGNVRYRPALLERAAAPARPADAERSESGAVRPAPLTLASTEGGAAPAADAALVPARYPRSAAKLWHILSLIANNDGYANGN